MSDGDKKLPKDQRRSPRYPAALEIELREKGRIRKLKTSDVSRHGLFIRTDEPAPDRHLLQMVVQIPDGPLEATAFVVRRVLSGTTRGMGAQFFVLSADAKKRWDTYLCTVAGRPLATRAEAIKLARIGPDAPTFLIKRRDARRLRDFGDSIAARTVLAILTPVLHAPGTKIALVLAHPVTEQELIVWATVSAAHEHGGKVIDVIADALTEEEHGALQRFLETGQATIEPDDLAQWDDTVDMLGSMSLDIIVEDSD